jgi:hypothetical protein
MNDLISTAIAILYSSSLFLGAGYGLKSLHDEVKKAALTKATKGLGSSEKLSNQLTGEKTDF